VIIMEIQQNECVLSAESHADLSNSTIASKNNGFDLFTPEGFFHCRQLYPDLGVNNDDVDRDNLKAPMHGTLIALMVATGATVKKGDTLVIMEAMKMEHTVVAPSDGVVTEFYFQTGSLVEADAELLSFEALDL
jgi:3-methylcrotonyl-CoA carboxylase alpha subunit